MIIIMDEEKELVIDHRKYPRYCCRITVFLNETQMHLYLCDLSLGGCFLEAPEEYILPRGSLVNLILFLPCIGPVHVEGIVQHHGSNTRKGMGIEFIHFHNRLHLVFAKFVKILPILEEARELYKKLIDRPEDQDDA